MHCFCDIQATKYKSFIFLWKALVGIWVKEKSILSWLHPKTKLLNTNLVKVTQSWTNVSLFFILCSILIICQHFWDTTRKPEIRRMFKNIKYTDKVCILVGFFLLSCWFFKVLSFSISREYMWSVYLINLSMPL